MGDYVFHVGRGELKRGDESVKLTERERDLLRLFAHRPGLPIARHELASLAAAGGVTRTSPLPRYIKPSAHPGKSDTPVIPSEHGRVVI
jgi:DNA-binding winged helix-turn-helix (wHTH) protein